MNDNDKWVVACFAFALALGAFIGNITHDSLSVNSNLPFAVNCSPTQDVYRTSSGQLECVSKPPQTMKICIDYTDNNYSNESLTNVLTNCLIEYQNKVRVTNK
jgi:hypothetical protein